MNAIWGLDKSNPCQVCSIKDIKKDDEIFVCYGLQYWLCLEINRIDIKPKWNNLLLTIHNDQRKLDCILKSSLMKDVLSEFHTRQRRVATDYVPLKGYERKEV